MRRLSPAIFLVLLPFVLNGQQTQYKKGWPNDPLRIDLRREFRNPPQGYGNVPFFWWNGDSLRMDLLVEADEGFNGGAIFASPVGFSVSEGLLQAGDWSSAGSLLHYSGGIRYRKDVTVPEGAGRVLLDLGRIVATCEVKVGGKDAGVMIAPPYRVDVTDLVHPGPNEVEVLVYSTLANHYQTVPTPYRGDPEAGLVGPVKLIVESK